MPLEPGGCPRPTPVLRSTEQEMVGVPLCSTWQSPCLVNCGIHSSDPITAPHPHPHPRTTDYGTCQPSSETLAPLVATQGGDERASKIESLDAIGTCLNPEGKDMWPCGRRCQAHRTRTRSCCVCRKQEVQDSSPGMAPLVGDGVIQFPRPRQVDTCRARVGVEERHRLPQCLAAASCGWWLPARHPCFPNCSCLDCASFFTNYRQVKYVDTLDSLHVTPTIPTIPNILPTAYNSTTSYSSLLYRIPSLQHTISSPHIHSIRRSTNTTMFKHLIDQLSQLYPPKPLFTEFELPDLKEKVFPEPSIPPSNSLKNKKLFFS